ncbi:MAG: hypothetical protein AB1327_00920 [Bacillota bacterium]
MPELDFIEEMGLLMEKHGGSKTLGRVFAYLILADQPKTLDEIAEDLLFSKATASLTIRQGLMLRFFEKVSIPGERKTHYRVNARSWINAMSAKLKAIQEWENLVDSGLSLVSPGNQAARENLEVLKDYFDFLRWYFADITEQYERWKKGGINPQKQRPKGNV